MAGKFKSRKYSNDSIGNRTRDLPARIAMRQPTALPRTLPKVMEECTASFFMVIE